jgi:hypothetical protein
LLRSRSPEGHVDFENSLSPFGAPIGFCLDVTAQRSRGRPKNVPAMPLEELWGHIHRFGSQLSLVHALGCSRSTMRMWMTGEVHVAAVWAARVRALPDPAPNVRARRGRRKNAATMSLREFVEHMRRRNLPDPPGQLPLFEPPASMVVSLVPEIVA